MFNSISCKEEDEEVQFLKKSLVETRFLMSKL